MLLFLVVNKDVYQSPIQMPSLDNSNRVYSIVGLFQVDNKLGLHRY